MRIKVSAQSKKWGEAGQDLGGLCTSGRNIEPPLKYSTVYMGQKNV